MRIRIACTLLLTIALISATSCGENKKKTPRPVKKNTAATTVARDTAAADHDKDVVDSDTFSKAFEKTTYKLEKTGGKTESAPKDAVKLFDKGPLAADKFHNDAYRNIKAPRRSLAAALDKKERYSWLPRWDYTGKGGVRIPSAAISADKSVLGILENVRTGKGSETTLLVLIGTDSMRILSILAFPEKTISKLVFLGKTGSAVLWEGLPGGRGKLHKVDLASGEIVGVSSDISAPLDSMVASPDGASVYVNLNSPKIHILEFDSGALGNPPKFLECSQRRGLLALSPDGKLVALAGPDLIELVKISDRAKLSEIESPLGVPPTAFVFMGDSSKMAALAYMKPCYVVAAGKAEKLRMMSGRNLEYLSKKKLLVVEEYKNKRISIINTNTMKEVSHFDPGKVKPHTSGSPVLISFLPRSGKYLVLDSRGNLCLFRLPGKKWKKEIIFSAQK